jgi:hypothetical protein
MLRKAVQEKSLINDGHVSLDPTDCQDIEGLFKKTIREGEEALILAVLEDAIACFQKYVLAQNEKEMNIFQEAEEWILKKNSDWFLSFENVCEILQLDPDYLRQGLMSWKEVQRKDRYVRTPYARAKKM